MFTLSANFCVCVLKEGIGSAATYVTAIRYQLSKSSYFKNAEGVGKNLMELNTGRYVILTIERDIPSNCTCVNKKAFMAFHDWIQKFSYNWLRLLIASNPTRLKKVMSRAEWYVTSPETHTQIPAQMTICAHNQTRNGTQSPQGVSLYPSDGFSLLQVSWLTPASSPASTNDQHMLGISSSDLTFHNLQNCDLYTEDRGTSLTETHVQFDVIRLPCPYCKWYTSCFHL